jgi:UDP-N-acetylglucosamine--N-acetylmuramyl-(pentapeptide) pyrophosphoryl-undecaprenol N-acetylglucosamine transferase
MEGQVGRDDPALGEVDGPGRPDPLARVDPVLDDLRQPIEAAWGARSPVLMMSSNGFGMGHIMRLLAVALRLPHDAAVSLFSLSAAADVLDRTSMPWSHMTSYRPAFRSWQWERQLGRRLGDLLDRTGAGTLLFDGVMPYQGLLDALAHHPRVRSVWLRRGLWKEDIGSLSLSRGAHFDHVIEPGELHGEVTVAQGAVEPVGPITLVDRSQMLDRATARRVLGIRPDERVLLLLWGASAMREAGSITRQVLEWVATTDHSVMLPGNPIRDVVLPANVRTFRSLPMAHLLRAFDAAVSSNGYNSSYELLVGGVPTVFVPNLATITDDQRARAELFEAAGVALHGGQTAASVIAQLEQVLDPAVQDRLRAAMDAAAWPNGAARAAALLREWAP